MLPNTPIYNPPNQAQWGDCAKEIRVLVWPVVRGLRPDRLGKYRIKSKKIQGVR